MPKVLNLPGSSGLVTPRDIAPHLSRFAVAGLITTQAVNLGMQVLWEMEKWHQRVIALSVENASKRYVTRRGVLVGGEVGTHPHTYIQALQDLHARAGIYSALTADAVTREDVEQYHFTAMPGVVSGRDWGRATPIYFRIPNCTKQHFLAAFDDAIATINEPLEEIVWD